MAAQAGPPDPVIPAAVQAGRVRLAGRLAAAADADRVLADAAQGAYAAAVAVHRRLDAIETELDGWLQSRPLIQTVPGAREFQRFLLATQRELGEIVAQARHDDAARCAALQAVQDRYQGAPE